MVPGMGAMGGGAIAAGVGIGTAASLGVGYLAGRYGTGNPYVSTPVGGAVGGALGYLLSGMELSAGKRFRPLMRAGVFAPLGAAVGAGVGYLSAKLNQKFYGSVPGANAAMAAAGVGLPAMSGAMKAGWRGGVIGAGLGLPAAAGTYLGRRRNSYLQTNKGYS